MPPVDYDYLHKLILLGDGGVGKSSLVLRFTKNRFDQNCMSTVGIDFAVKSMVIDRKKIKAQIWDTAGQERFVTITPAYYRGAMGAIIVYDVTSVESLTHAKHWLSQLRLHADVSTMSILLVGNKCDLQDKRVVSAEEGEEVASQLGAHFIETSALNATGVEEAFQLIVTEILHHRIQWEATDEEKNKQHAHHNTVPLSAASPVQLRPRSSRFMRNAACCNNG